MRHKVKMFSADEERELWQRMKQGDQEARRLLIESMIPWVKRVASKCCFKWGWADTDEAESEALLKLTKMIEELDPSRGRLSSVISVAIPRYLKVCFQRARVISLPTNEYKDGHPLAEAAERAASVTRIDKVSKLTDSPLDLHDHRAPFTPDPAKEEELEEIRRRTAYAKTKLRDRDRQVFERYYEGEEILDSIGASFGITRERARQIRERALFAFREAYENCPPPEMFSTKPKERQIMSNDGTIHDVAPRVTDALEAIEQLSEHEIAERIAKLDAQFKQIEETFKNKRAKLVRLQKILFPGAKVPKAGKAKTGRLPKGVDRPHHFSQPYKLWCLLSEAGPLTIAEAAKRLNIPTTEANNLLARNTPRWFERVDTGKYAIAKRAAS